MTNENRRRMTRRQFMKEAAIGALTMKCITMVGAEEAWAEAVLESDRQTIVSQLKNKSFQVKPLLTPENLNKFYQANWGSPDFLKLAAEAKTNLEQFLLKYFTLTKDQLNNLRTKFKSAELAQVNKFIDTIVKSTQEHIRTKRAGSPGQITPIGSPHECPQGTSLSCVRISLGWFEVEYCWCAK